MKQNEKKLLRKSTKQHTLSNSREPSFAATYKTEMSKLNNPQQIQDYLNKHHSLKQIAKDKMCVEAIICYGKMHEYSFGYSLFAQTKQDGICRKDTYAAIMWLMLEQNRTVSTMDKCFDLLIEMKDLFKWNPSANCYQVLLSNITTLKLWSHGIRLINDIRTQNKEILHKSFVVRSSIVNFYTKSTHFESALQFMHSLKKEYGNDVLKDSDYMFSSILAGIAAVINTKTTGKERIQHINIAESVFKTCYLVNNRAPMDCVFSALIDVYGTVGDIGSCLDVLDSMQNKDIYPNPTIFTITSVFKGLNDDIEYEYLWNVVHHLLDIMTRYNIKKDTIFYTNLFGLIGKIGSNHDLMHKLKGFYQEMVSVDMLIPTQYTMGSFIINGLNVFGYRFKNEDNVQSIKNDLEEFVDWVLSEYTKYNVVMDVNTQMNINKRIKYLMSTYVNV